MKRKKFSIKPSQIPDIKTVLNETLKGSSLRLLLNKGVIINLFNEIINSLNPIFNSTVKVEDLNLKTKIIVVNVKNSTVKNEIFMYRSYIMNMINEKAGKKVINKIIFK
ncbi:MAG: hypothetical protein CR982_02895 [Candidatus Cloacimonadota bacterium]|nr:MAG: hypothetical protein CR982_02895 [Candidatus Cloacimonadota bacterium]PIE79216.1 MAG: hypothetical protein CSA15_04090 [Candidatus Delongbacteria bacterium]